MDEERKDWECENGHVLGVVIRASSGVRKLHLLVYPEYGRSVIARIEGAAEIVCQVCYEKRRWVPDEESMKRMVDRMTKRKGGTEIDLQK